MTLSYLVDTDWIIHYLNGNRKVVEKLGSLKDEGLSISIISLAELYEGIYYYLSFNALCPRMGIETHAGIAKCSFNMTPL